jgi:hypothetical protein
MKRSIVAAATLSAVCSLPVSAGEISMNEHYSLEGVHTLVISQKELSPVTIGINIVPIATTIDTYPGNDLLLSIEGSSILGTVGTPRIESESGSGILTLDIGYRSPFKAGLRAGNIRIGLLIPESYSGSLQLQEMKSPTEVNSLSLKSFSAVMRSTRLTIRELDAQRIDLVLHGRAKTECNSVRAEQWRVECRSGAFIAKEIRGEVELDSFDGNTDIAFSRFDGRSDIRSGGGNITIRLPDNSNLAMELISKTKMAESDFDLIGESNRVKKGRKSGIVGSASDNCLFARTRFGTVRVLRLPAGGR